MEKTDLIILFTLAISLGFVIYTRVAARSNITRLYTILKRSVPDAQIIQEGRIVKIIYPEGHLPSGNEALGSMPVHSFINLAAILNKFEKFHLLLSDYASYGRSARTIQRDRANEIRKIFETNSVNPTRILASETSADNRNTNGLELVLFENNLTFQFNKPR